MTKVKHKVVIKKMVKGRTHRPEVYEAKGTEGDPHYQTAGLGKDQHHRRPCILILAPVQADLTISRKVKQVRTVLWQNTVISKIQLLTQSFQEPTLLAGKGRITL